MSPADQHRIALVGINLLSAGIFTFKCVLLMLVQMWVRWTFPRPRIDQVLYVCIKGLLPLACLLLLGAAAWQLFLPERSGIPWQDYQPWLLSDWVSRGVGPAWITQVVLSLLMVVFVISILSWIAYAFLTGRQDHQRLSEPEAI
jgi:hypothetical protein